MTEIKMRAARVRLLSEELDRAEDGAEARRTSVMGKASFLAVAAGIFIAASTVQSWTELPHLGVLSLALACLAMVCAVVASRPGKRLGLVPRRLVDRYLDSTLTASQVEEQICVDKAAALSSGEVDLASRAKWVTLGFAFLLVASVALLVAFSFEVLGG